MTKDEATKKVIDGAKILFESHCLGAGHSENRMCPVCVDYCEALAAGNKLAQRGDCTLCTKLDNTCTGEEQCSGELRAPYPLYDDAAALVAILAHKGQKYGKFPYTYHLQMVVSILEHYKTKPIQIAAGWLHDVIEDTGLTSSNLLRVFGPELATIVDACTGYGATREERNACIREKLLKTPQALPVKLADRMVNIHSCIIDNNVLLLGKYLGEDPEFSKPFKDRVDPSMWDEYRALVTTRKPIPWLLRR